MRTDVITRRRLRHVRQAPAAIRSAVARRLALSALLALLLAAMATAMTMATATAARADFLVVSPPRPQPPDPACPLCDIIERQMDQGCGPQHDQPFADVHELRHPGQLALPADIHAALSRARATQDPASAARRLAPLYAHPEADIRYVAAITVAMMHLQAGIIADDRAATALAVASEAARAPGLGIPASDLAFLQARRARERGDDDAARTHLAEALQLEPRYFNALVLALELALERAILVGQQSRALCESAYLDFMAALVAIMDLSPCRFHAAHLDVHLSRRFVQPDALPAVQMARVYLGLLAERPSAASAALARFGEAQLPCRQRLMPELERMLQRSGAGAP